MPSFLGDHFWSSIRHQALIKGDARAHRAGRGSFKQQRRKSKGRR